MKWRGSEMRKAPGPWSPGRLAACRFAQNFAQHSKTWHWAAQPLDITAPEPLARANSADGPLRVQGVALIPTPNPAPRTSATEVSRGNYPASAGKPVSPLPAVSAKIARQGPVKPAPPTPAVDVARGGASNATVKPASPSLVTLPVRTPSGPFSANLSEDSSPPS